MTEKRRPKSSPPTAPAGYEPPAIEWEEDVDVRANLAAACAEFSGQGGQCDQSPGS